MKNSYYLLLAIAAFIILAQCKSGPEKEETSEDVEETETSEEMQARYIEMGNAIVDTTFKTLGGKLKGAVKEGGIEGAIEYCNLNAYPIVDELSKANNATISRKSQKYRNADNKTDSSDDFIYERYREAIAAGAPMEAFLIDNPTENMISYYKPIMQLEFCGVCHGSKEAIGPSYSKIADLYPDDLAVDFETGDLRGLWRVDFSNE